MNIIELNNLNKIFKHNKITIEVLKEISLQIQTGEFVSIIGPSGSGKTTLLYVMSGLEPYTKGSAKLFQREIKTYRDKDLTQLRQSKLGFIFQFYNLISNLTVYENILLAVVLSSKDNKKNIEHILKFVGLEDFKNHYPADLSGGMQQRVAIARCLITDPDVIFADEPTGNLDYKNSLVIMKLFKRLNQEFNKTIILVTHNEDLIQFGSRYLKLKDGNVVVDEQVNR